jgi:thymidylate synthase
MHQENQYLDLVRQVIENGQYEKTRNGGTYSIFGHQMRFSLLDGTIPLITTKYLAWKTCFRELMWFVRGQTDNHILNIQGVHIWDKNATREILDSMGKLDACVDDLGPIYGHQWRHFGADYKDCYTNYTGKGVDQLKYVIDQLKDPLKRSSRRLVISAWNPTQIDEMALPPCHVLMQFNVRRGTHLSCSLYQRSGDIGLGVPFNIASYSFLTHLLAKHCGLIADEFIYTLGNAHIYEDHFTALSGQIQRTPFPFPKIIIKNGHENIEDYDVSDIDFLEPYNYHPTIKMDMIA